MSLNPPINCPSREMLSQFLGEQLGDDDTQFIVAHVDQCQQCQQSLDDLTSVVSPIASHSPVVVRDVTLVSLIQRLQNDSSPFEAGETIRVGTSTAGNPTDLSGQQIGDYRLQQLIGWGGTGAVYRAQDPKLNRWVAVKILRSHLLADPDAVRRMEREAKNIAAISHDNILNVFGFHHGDANSDISAPYLVTELVDGNSLQQTIQRHGALPAERAAETIAAVARGLAAAHQGGTIHRDVKPSNILIDGRNQRPKIADFGLAIDENFDSKITRNGCLAGTPAYMSPEQVRDHSTLDRRTDIYSLGVVLFECLTGEVPFRGLSPATIQRIGNELPEDPRKLNPQIPRDLASICLKAMSKEPGRRYQQAGDFADDLQRYRQGQATLARPVSSLEKLQFWVRRNKSTAAFSAAIFGLLLLLAIGSSWAALSLATAQRTTKLALVEQQYQGDIARRQRDALMKTVQQLVYRVNDSLEQEIVDQDELQQQLLRIALQGLNASATVAGEEHVELSTAEICLRLGIVSYRLDETKVAIEHLERAISITTDLQIQQPDDACLSRLMARCRWWLASTYDIDDQPQRAIKAFNVAQKLSETLLQSDEALIDVDFLTDVGLGYLNAAEFHLDFLRPEEALRQTAAAKEIANLLKQLAISGRETKETFADPAYNGKEIRIAARKLTAEAKRSLPATEEPDSPVPDIQDDSKK